MFRILLIIDFSFNTSQNTLSYSLHMNRTTYIIIILAGMNNSFGYMLTVFVVHVALDICDKLWWPTPIP